jgi:hypothetical protein
VQAGTQASDTVWAGVFDINGLGLTFDLAYSVHKEQDYYFAISAKNLGFIHWNGNTFTASIDTAFRFEGISLDTTSGANGNVPGDYSYRNLRRLLFKDPDGSSFTKGTPLILNLSGGKYFAGGRFYAGMNAWFYPSLAANYKVELFATFNHRSVFQLTPILSYSAYQKVHVGLAAGLRLGNDLLLQAGSQYLDSFFIGGQPAGQGGFFRLVFNPSGI